MQDGSIARERVAAVIVDNILKALSYVKETRETAEQQLKTLEISQGYSSTLVVLLLRSDLDPSCRQMSSVLLKQFIEAHWSSIADSYSSFQVDSAEKTFIRESLLVGLQDPLRKIRSCVAHLVSLIASWDWPEQWAELFGILKNGLSPHQPHLTHGCMRVLTEFCRELSEKQTEVVIPSILPPLLTTLLNHHDFGLRTRGRCVNIFTTCTNLVHHMRGVHKGAGRELLLALLPSYLDAFLHLLQVPDGCVSDRALKAEILNALSCVMGAFPRHMRQHSPQILASVYSLLTSNAHKYTQEVVNSVESLEEEVDSDCEVVGYGGVTEALFEFIHELLDMPQFKVKVKRSSADLFKFIIIYMQPTHLQLERWVDEGSEWLEDEEEESFKHSIRISAKQLLNSIFELFPRTSTTSLHSCALQVFADADALRSQGDANWWKLYEATLLAIGNNSDVVIQYHNNNNNNKENKNTSNNNNNTNGFDVGGLMHNVVLPLLSQDVPLCLRARLLWLSSRLSSLLSRDVLQLLLQGTIECFSADKPAYIQLQALHCLHHFSQHFHNYNTKNNIKQGNNSNNNQTPNNNINNNMDNNSQAIPNSHNNTQTPNNTQPLNTNNDWLGAYVGRMVEVVVMMAMKDDSRVLNTCLQTLSALLQVNADTTACMHQQCITLMMAVFNKYSKDASLLDMCEEIFSVLISNHHCLPILQQQLLPVLLQHLQLNNLEYGLQAMCMQVLTKMVRHSTLPLPSPLITHAFPIASQCALTTQDFTTLEAGAECMRAYVSRDLAGLLKWSDHEGSTGVGYVMKVIERLLEAKTPEFTASFAGRLIWVLMEGMGEMLGDNMQAILKAVLIKLTMAETSTATQSLVMVFAHLMHSHMQAVIDFLSSVPGPSGKSALQFVLTEWTAKQHLFIGDYERKVSSIALSKLIEFSVSRDDERLQGIVVQGEEISNKQQGVKTRAKSEPDGWTEIPVLVKMYKLLINELSNQLELARVQSYNDEEDDEEDEEDEDGIVEEEAEDEDDDEDGGNIFEDFLDTELDDDDDEDVTKDPINKIQLQEYLAEFLRSLSQQGFYSFFSNHHNPSETTLLRSIGINL